MKEHGENDLKNETTSARDQILSDIANLSGGTVPVIPVVEVEKVYAITLENTKPVVNERSERMKKGWVTRKANLAKKKAEAIEAPETPQVALSRSDRAKRAWVTRRANLAKLGPASLRTAKKDYPASFPKKGNATEKGQIFTLAELTAREVVKVPTNIEGLDRLLGGGFVRNSAILFAGKRGHGKSTLMTVVAGNMAKNTKEKILYVSGEEGASQLAFRANRMKLPMTLKNLYILDDAHVDLIDKFADEIKPTMIIIDSVQSLKGTVNGKEVRNSKTANYFTERLRQLRKKHQAILILVGHETKTGEIAGDGALQHEVDVVLKLDPDPVTNAKVLESDKNRFAPEGVGFRFMIRDHEIEAVSAIAQMEYKGPEILE